MSDVVNHLSQLVDKQIAADGGAKVLEACKSVEALEGAYPEIAAAIRDEAAGTGITPEAALEHVRGHVVSKKDVPATPAPATAAPPKHGQPHADEKKKHERE